jgi:hypothetical protein
VAVEIHQADIADTDVAVEDGLDEPGVMDVFGHAAR